MSEPQHAEVASGPVEALYEDYKGLVADLSTSSPSGLAALNRSYHKHLLVAAASSLEDRVKRLLPEMFRRHGREELATFVDKQVVARGYHTLFDWKNESARGFFTSFGEVCGKHFKKALADDDNLKRQHAAFMRLGNFRNQVVHNDYATYPIETTPEEVINQYRDALIFVARLESLTLGIIEDSGGAAS